MPKYEPDNIICLDGWCRADRILKQEGITTWTTPKQARICCKFCPDLKGCEKPCNVVKKKCFSMEYYKNTDHMDGNYFRKDNIKSKFYKPDNGIRWWVIHTEEFFNTNVRIASECFYSEEDARKWMATFTKSKSLYLIKGKYIDTKEMK
jgi:hypothetical protein